MGSTAGAAGTGGPCGGVTACGPDGQQAGEKRRRLGKNGGAADSVLWKEITLWRMLIRGNVAGNMGKTS